jgi:hypothetical protein
MIQHASLHSHCPPSAAVSRHSSLVNPVHSQTVCPLVSQSAWARLILARLSNNQHESRREACTANPAWDGTLHILSPDGQHGNANLTCTATMLTDFRRVKRA